MSGLVLRGVQHAYVDDHPVLHDVDLAVPAGGALAVVGPSGSGKTTLLRVAAGLERPLRGEVLVDGADVTDLPPEQRGTTVLFQQPHLFDHLDVRGNVAFAPKLAGASRREARREADRYLGLVHLDGLARRRVGTLSGGQQQRVALARALATRRGVLLLDEPFSALDRELRAAMHDLLDEVRDALAPTVLLVTHDLDEAALADEVAVLIDGRVHQCAPAPVLHARPATLAVARLVGGSSGVAGEVRGGEDDGVHSSAWGRFPVAPGCPATGPATLLLRREDLVVERVDDRASAAPPADGAVPGRVVKVRSRGPRQVVDVRAAEGLVLEVELPPGAVTVALGDEVVVRLAPGASGWAVAAGADGP